ncbi:uncharacterized protein BKA78DRAFT_158062 [Phyllosticta capitalensis]|uniref:uncharacterized protein n=1 Tax=Phyllosticta capitalensis TaxID=121624 RepID=UPI003130FE4E
MNAMQCNANTHIAIIAQSLACLPPCFHATLLESAHFPNSLRVPSASRKHPPCHTSSNRSSPEKGRAPPGPLTCMARRSFLAVAAAAAAAAIVLSQRVRC